MPSKRLIFFLLFAVLGISFVFYGWQIVYTPNILVDKEDRVIVIPEGANFKTVQALLHTGMTPTDGRYVEDLVSFSFLAKLMDYDKSVKPGLYVLKKNMTNIEAIRLMRSGNQLPVNITFNNVRTIDELAEKITKNLVMKPEEFNAALISFAMDNHRGFNQDNIISMFIPNTYEVYYNLAPKDLVDRMLMEYENFWNAERKKKASDVGLTPTEVSTLASIVQAESIKADEAPVIAGLYLNRLKQGIPLQADPTLKFAVKDFALKRVLNVHKQVDSPYNTYTHAGLPPGPINMPEINALNAVLNYKNSDYLYMCAKEDFSGRHNFTSNYNEHLRNAARYQNALTIEQRIGERLRKQNKK